MAQRRNDDTPEPRIVDRDARNVATSSRDHGGGPPSEAPAISGRPNDLKIREDSPILPNSTLASRAKQAAARGKQVKAAEDKAVDGADSK